MNYFVISNDGQKYGPADVPTLNQWAQEGRVFPTSMLEDAATGARVPANQVPGINFPPPNQGQPQGYQQYPRANFATDDGSSDVTKVWIFSALAIVPCCPLIFGILAIVFATYAQKKGHPQGQTALIVAIIALVLGLGISGFINVNRLRGFR